jgi:hypothetical protein
MRAAAISSPRSRKFSSSGKRTVDLDGAAERFDRLLMLFGDDLMRPM